MSKKKQLTPRELLKVVELGLVLSGTSTEISNRAEDWAGLSQKAYRGWDKFPRFDNITEFNPRLSSFVDGKWVRPTPVQN